MNSTHEFRRCVARYRGQYRVRSFSCWDQFLSMAFAQLTYRESLRDIETCLRALGGKLYPLRIRGHISRSTLADANETRDWRIFADLAGVLITMARPLYTDDPLGVELEETAIQRICAASTAAISRPSMRRLRGLFRERRARKMFSSSFEWQFRSTFFQTLHLRTRIRGRRGCACDSPVGKTFRTWTASCVHSICTRCARVRVVQTWVNVGSIARRLL